MALTPYCEPEEIRAALGVNEEELSDAVLNLPIYQIGLMRELNKFSTSLPALFTVAAGKTEANRTLNERAIYDATRLFSVYCVAKQAGVSLPGFMLKGAADGKANYSRLTDSAEQTLANVGSMLMTASAALAATVALVTSTPVAARTYATIFAISSRTYDPVTDGA